MRRPLIIFYLLVFYAVAELVWWGILMVRADPGRSGMILGEGAVFLLLLSYGVYRLHKALNEQAALHRQQRNFLLSVTHELKSPLASIKLYLQTIQKRRLPAEQQQKFIANSLKDIERLDDLVENMLLATKIENKSYTFPKEELDFSALVKEVLDRFSGEYRLQDRIVGRISKGICLKGDKFALSLMVSNLVENALKYSPHDAPVEVELKEEGGRASLKISDQGVGIPVKERERIFGKFYRIGNEETRQTRGTGLGLFIVKQVLDNHGGSISLRDNEPQGTVFEILI